MVDFIIILKIRVDCIKIKDNLGKSLSAIPGCDDKCVFISV